MTRECPRGVMVKAVDCEIIVSEFELQSRYYIHFQANTLGKGMNPLILLRYRLNSIKLQLGYYVHLYPGKWLCRRKLQNTPTASLHWGKTHPTSVQDMTLNNPTGCPRGVMVKAMDCGIVVSSFILQSRYYVHFQANTLGKGMNPLILPAMG